MDMIFIQFKFPNARKVRTEIQRDSEIENLAAQLYEAGWSFEIEINPDTQIVHMDICDDDRALSNRVCRNGQTVPQKVDELTREAFGLWVSEGNPKAVGFRKFAVNDL